MKNKFLLSVSGLNITLEKGSKTLTIVRDLSFSIRQGDILGLIGESGSGKSLTALSIMGLLPNKNFRVTGDILFNGVNLNQLNKKNRRKYLGNEISMIFQEPMTSLNPLVQVGKQISEPLKIHQSLNDKQAYSSVIKAMGLAELPNPEAIYNYYPHQLSGGLRQRVMIAMALVCTPKLLIADEPTTALDVVVQKEILTSIKKISKELNISVLFISHDLRVIKSICNDIAVLYAGSLMEYGKCTHVFSKPQNEYTKALLLSIPKPEQKGKLLDAIPGIVPPTGHIFSGCPFSPRCKQVKDICKYKMPDFHSENENHFYACHKEEESGERKNT